MIEAIWKYSNPSKQYPLHLQLHSKPTSAFKLVYDIIHPCFYLSIKGWETYTGKLLITFLKRKLIKNNLSFTKSLLIAYLHPLCGTVQIFDCQSRSHGADRELDRPSSKEGRFPKRPNICTPKWPNLRSVSRPRVNGTPKWPNMWPTKYSVGPV